MQFQEMPDPFSESLCRLADSFPRDKIAAPSIAIYRDEARKHPIEVVNLAVEDIKRSKSRFPALCDWIASLERNAASAPSSIAGSLHPSAEEYAKLSPKQRQMIAHANDVIWAADFERRQAARPPNLRNMNVAKEILAHGVRITQNGEKVQYDIAKVLNPDFDCEFGKHPVAVQSGNAERMFSESTREWTAES